MADSQLHYASYLFRLWLEPGEAGPTWRVSLEDVHTGERRGFANLEGLFAFLLEHTQSITLRLTDLSETKGESSHPEA